ncbi:MAG: ERF family protein [Epibacterium sp.]|nr:ERF family protein [Epibacterium sp.]NQX75596.1 ERF family protein [Epibacterium sp.]
MTKHDPIEAPQAVRAHSSIAMALASAQLSMGKALKQSQNSHFRNKYADLGNVVDACMPALNENGIAVIQPTIDEGGERFVKTVLIHGETGETLECRVPLIVAKNDMQGYGSAVTYARRYGLMAMTGVAPEDDDGNAAAAAAPKSERRPNQSAKPSEAREAERVADSMIASIKQYGAAKVGANEGFRSDFARLNTVSKSEAARVQLAIDNWHQENKPPASSLVDDDEIPY